MNVVFRPIDKWPGARTDYPQRSRFKASYSATLRLLDRELAHLDAERVVIQLALEERDIRQDGLPRANARPSHQGVILAFDSKHGPLKYPCDTFDDWQDNLRGIALALEHLRAVDRYGVTRRGEQYTGWKALPGPGGSTETMDVHAAADLIARASGVVQPHSILTDPDGFQAAYRRAARELHPDGNGTVEAFQRLQVARQVLAAHHGEG